ncbi:hypothetical protein ALC57_08700 [Trachymyrmex cornetzi]|uniref:Uncharacterized protein n=1 Tax=Trachymyrmex cornetzi TaxID=471704 RepID=A0A195E282_9HYME|nr:hypothetical protein ALC57_08700 [Trachymyrmex cornetzi]
MSLGVLTILDWDLTLWHRTRGRMMAMQRRTRARVILHKNIPGWLRHIAETENFVS